MFNSYLIAMAKIHFYLNGRNDAQGKRSIMLWVRGVPRGNTVPIVIHTLEAVPLNQWDKKKERVKSTYTGSPELNRLLQKYQDDVEACIRTMIADGNNDYDTVKTALINLFAPKKKSDFLAVYDEYLAVQELSWQPNTIKKFKTLRQYFVKFQEEIEPLVFERINAVFLDKFRLFLLNDVQLLNNTAHKIIKMLKLFMRWAEKREYHSNIKYRDFKAPKNDETEVVYLSESELMRIYNHDFSSNAALEKVRDVFCFQTFTGQRFSDIVLFRHNAVQDGFWKLRTTKTKDILSIYLSPSAIAIADKYRDMGTLPVISAQKTNIYLKQICEIVGIDTPTTIVRYRGSKRIERTVPKWNLISTHTARRTFVSLSLAKGMESANIMRITGHKTHAMLDNYVGISDDTVRKAMEKAWK